MFFFFFFNDTATTEIYTLSLHDALPIYLFLRDLADFVAVRLGGTLRDVGCALQQHRSRRRLQDEGEGDRKSTRLNSSHGYISYAVFCLKKKKPLRGAGVHGEHHSDCLRR